MADKVVIGIHGLANEPARDALQESWKAALVEGLQKNENNTTDFDFELVYWADYLYKHPLHSDADFDSDELFNDEPYYVTNKNQLESYEDGWRDELRSRAFGLAGDAVDALKRNFGMDALADAFLSVFLRDLAYYAAGALGAALWLRLLPFRLESPVRDEGDFPRPMGVAR